MFRKPLFSLPPTGTKMPLLMLRKCLSVCWETLVWVLLLLFWLFNFCSSGYKSKQFPLNRLRTYGKIGDVALFTLCSGICLGLTNYVRLHISNLHCCGSISPVHLCCWLNFGVFSTHWQLSGWYCGALQSLLCTVRKTVHCCTLITNQRININLKS